MFKNIFHILGILKIDCIIELIENFRVWIKDGYIKIQIFNDNGNIFFFLENYVIKLKFYFKCYCG